MNQLTFSGKPKNQPPKVNETITGRGSLQQRLRLWSGLVIMAFVTLHFINHALGNVSIDAMNVMQVWRTWFWQSIPGSILLYGSFIIHISLSMWKLINKRSFRMPFWEWSQIILGLLIPWFLLTHIMAMRGTFQQFGILVDYPLALGMIWPGAGLSQSFLLLITWFHGCLGLHFWLRMRPKYINNIGWIASVAVLIPAFAITGWINAARLNYANFIKAKETNPELAEQHFGTIQFIFGEIIPQISVGQSVLIGLGLLILAIIISIQVALRFRKRIRVEYGDGKAVTATPGTTILEISRQANIPHMAVCGGRARCSTCRTLIIEGEESLLPKTEAEELLLTRLNADPSIRLACQAKVNGHVKLRPLIQPNQQDIVVRSGDPLGWGVERPIAVLFLDIRGFSKISEKSLPYDIVFILNSFFGQIATAVESNHGYVDKFMGDGMMALFGLETGPEEAARNAINAAVECSKANQRVSRILTQHLDDPIRIGVGIHTGGAVVGRIGKTNDQNTPSRLTAIGDTVNVAARLEQATKELACELVISSETAEQAGITDFSTFAEQSEIKVRNISRPVSVLAVNDLKALEAKME